MTASARSILATGAIAGVVLVGATACSQAGIDADLLAAVNASDGHDVRLDAIVEGDWDSFLVVCPYDPGVNERLGFEWDAAPDTNASDNSQMIVFVENERVVSTTRFRFDDIDLCTDIWELLPRNTALQFTRPAKHVWHAVP
jgi:hypothetical protein